MRKRKALVLGAFVSLALWGCSSCSERGGGSSVPEFEGMSIARNSSSTQPVNDRSVKKAANRGTGTSDSSEGDAPAVSEYDDHEEGEDVLEEGIEDLAKTNAVTTDDEVTYYVRPNETFTIEIHLSNPDQYEIQSFTLNGKKYSSYMFKEGSTMDLLLLETTAPSTPGYFEYTIEAMKYIDGTEIKDVKMTGDKTVKTGIEYPTAPTASLSSLDVSTNHIDLGIDVLDPYSIIGRNDVAVYLSDGKDIVDVKPLTIGNNRIRFDDLEAHTLYEYGVAATFDLVDGREERSEWLLTNRFETKGIFSLYNVQATKTSVSFDVKKNGTAGRIDSISLYDDSTGRLVASGDAGTRRFDGLLSNRQYNLYVDFSYLLDGTSISDWVGEDVQTTALSEPTIAIDYASADKTSVRYTVSTSDDDAICSIDKVELIRNGTVVESNDGLASGTFSNLLSNSEYVIKVSYSYDLNDGSGSIHETVEKDISTLAKVEPEVEIASLSSDKTSVHYAVDMTDEDGVGSIDRVELLRDGEVLDSNDGLREGTFTNLLSNNTYEIRVSYSYDLNDGQGVRRSFVEKTVQTEAKVKPTVAIERELVTESTISGDLIFDDRDSTGVIDSVELYDGSGLVATSGSDEIDFTGLSYYTDYRVVVNYSYDLGDGQGMVKDRLEKAYRTSPYVGFESCEVINSSAVSDGETIFLEASLDNPLGALPESVVVNGQTYNCTGSTSANRMYIEILYSGQFEGGDTSLTIEKVTMSLDGEAYTIIPASNNVATVFINGEFLVDSLKVVNAKGEEIRYCFPSEDAFIEIKIDNESGYRIDGFTLGTNSVPDNRFSLDMDNLVQVDANTYRCKIDFIDSGVQYDASAFVFKLNSVSYSNDYIRKSIDTDIQSNRFFRMQSDEVVEIKDLDDLLHTEYTYGARYYKLMNDIDLSGMAWTHLPRFSGVFDGNGHTIRNMTNVSTIYDKDVEIGLFEDIYSDQMAVFKDLSIANMKILVDHRTSDPNRQYALSIGGFVAGYGQGNSCYFENCSIDGDISVNSTMRCENDSYGIFVGDFVGCLTNGNEVSFTNCDADVSIGLHCSNFDEDDSRYVYCGILVGYIFCGYVEKLSIVDSSITGTMDAEQLRHVADRSGVLFGFKDDDIRFWGDQGYLEIVDSALDVSDAGGIVFAGTENFIGTLKEYMETR